MNIRVVCFECGQDRPLIETYVTLGELTLVVSPCIKCVETAKVDAYNEGVEVGTKEGLKTTFAELQALLLKKRPS